MFNYFFLAQVTAGEEKRHGKTHNDHEEAKNGSEGVNTRDDGDRDAQPTRDGTKIHQRKRVCNQL